MFVNYPHYYYCQLFTIIVNNTNLSYGIVKMIQDFTNDGGYITWSCVLREANQVVECLANFVMTLKSSV